ncbi:hypothetical protein TRVA0_003S02124 [Trichomonascus vanleenenianus]|uniref:double-stranded DNA-dependent ATPase n=1 Tax=Trichomonascus vanleenenianus TaxID=2268995 RepID=UPI003ECA8E68
MLRRLWQRGSLLKSCLLSRSYSIGALGSHSLRGYQIECINACLEAFRQKKRRIGVSLATGGGKTVIFSHLLSRVDPVNGHGDKVLIVAHRGELIHQAYERVTAINPDLSVEIEMANHKASGEADVTIASIQSVTRRPRLEKFDPKDYKLIIIDEAHHAAAEQYMKLLRHFGADVRDSNVAVAGFSATMFRRDKQSLSKIMDELVYHRDFLYMIDTGWLCPVKITTIRTYVDYSNIEMNKRTGDYKEAPLSEAISTPLVNELVVKAWAHHSQRGTKYKSTMVFAVDIAHTVDLANEFRRYGVEARVVTSNTRRSERKKTVEDFKQQKFPVLINCGVFTEGTDIPNIDMIILDRPTTSDGLLAQMIGRGLRQSPGKDHCHIIDLVGSTASSELVTVPKMFGLPPELLVEPETDMMELKKLLEEEDQREQNGGKERPEWNSIGKVEFETYDSVEEYMARGIEGQLKDHAKKLNWLRTNESTYILSGFGSHLRLVVSGHDTYKLLRYYPIPPKINDKRANVVARQVLGENIQGLAKVMEQVGAFIEARPSIFPKSLLDPDSQWRESKPTEGQLKELVRLTSRVKPELLAEASSLGVLLTDPADRGTLSRGELSDFIQMCQCMGVVSQIKFMVRQARQAQAIEQANVERQRREARIARYAALPGLDQTRVADAQFYRDLSTPPAAVDRSVS